MAATKWYGKGGYHLANQDVDWSSATFKLALTTSAYALSKYVDEFFDDVTNEITGPDYVAGGYTLTSCTLSYDPATGKTQFLADDVNEATLTPAAAFRYGIVYLDTGTPSTSPLVGYINFGTDQNPAGLPFVLQWLPTGVLYTQPA